MHLYIFRKYVVLENMTIRIWGICIAGKQAANTPASQEHASQTHYLSELLYFFSVLYHLHPPAV